MENRQNTYSNHMIDVLVILFKPLESLVNLFNFKISSTAFRNIVSINFVLVSTVCYCSPKVSQTDTNKHVSLVKSIDSINIKTACGSIEITRESDLRSGAIFYFANFNNSCLQNTYEKGAKLNIYKDVGTLQFEITNSGELIECKLGIPPKLNQFNLFLQQFVAEINNKYKYEIVTRSPGKINNDNSIFSLPVEFQIFD
jgi:hypothetical protein